MKPQHQPAISSHLNEKGEVRMVDVGRKETTARMAVAMARVEMAPETAARLRAGDTPKGDVLATARLAGIMAAKRTSELIPLCHAIALTRVSLDIALDDGGATVSATAEARDRTGVEMEAMVAASTAALTLYDMLKGIDRGIRYTVFLSEKRGGKTGRLDARSRVESGNEWAVGCAARRGGSMSLFEVREHAFGVDEAIEAVSHPGAGGVDVFIGKVRDVSDGLPVSELIYEAYVPMAQAEMARIAAEISTELPGVRLAALHRVGTLRVGDIAVVCAASAPHRAEAFDACRRLIDRIKLSVPIWKRERGEWVSPPTPAE